MVYKAKTKVSISFNEIGIKSNEHKATGRHLFYVKKVVLSNDVLTIEQDTVSERLIKIPIEWIETLLIEEDVD